VGKQGRKKCFFFRNKKERRGLVDGLAYELTKGKKKGGLMMTKKTERELIVFEVRWFAGPTSREAEGNQT